MKKTILISVAALALAAGAVFAGPDCPSHKQADTVKTTGVKAEKKNCGDCPSHKQAGAKKCGNKICPEAMEGVETVVKTTTDGIEKTLTARNAETIAKLQELTLVYYSNKETMGKDCPSRVKGAEARIENTATGVKVYITGKTPVTVKNIQAASAKKHMKAGCPEEHGKKEAKASKKYACPMKCAESDKPGKCPKCGMNMTEKK